MPSGRWGAHPPRTPAAGEGVETPPLHGAPTHVPGPTPELCASLPSGSLATWSAEEVSRCLRVLGRDFTRDECDATDVSIFDTAAVTCQLDGNQLAAVTGDALRAMGFVRYEHRAAIMDWIRHRLEVRPGVFFPPRWQSGNERKTRFGFRPRRTAGKNGETSATARARPSSHVPSRVAADAPRVAADAPRVGRRAATAVAAARSAPETRRGRHLVSAVARLSVAPQPSPSNASTSRQDGVFVAASAADASSPNTAAVPHVSSTRCGGERARVAIVRGDRVASGGAGRVDDSAARRRRRRCSSYRNCAPRTVLSAATRGARACMRRSRTRWLCESRATRGRGARGGEGVPDGPRRWPARRTAATKIGQSRAARFACVRTRPLDARASAAGHLPSVRPTPVSTPAQRKGCCPRRSRRRARRGRARAASREAERRSAARAEEKRSLTACSARRHAEDVYAEISPLVTGALDGFSVCSRTARRARQDAHDGRRGGASPTTNEVGLNSAGRVVQAAEARRRERREGSKTPRCSRSSRCGRSE